MRFHKNHGKPKTRDPAPGPAAGAAAGPSLSSSPVNPSTSGAASPPGGISKGATTMATGSNPIMFLDLAQNFQSAIQATLADVSDLYLQYSQNGGLTPDLIQQLTNDVQFLLNAAATNPSAGITIPAPPTALAGSLPTAAQTGGPPTPPTVLDPMFSGIWDLTASPIKQVKIGIRDTLVQITTNTVGDIDVSGQFPSQLSSARSLAAAAAAGAGGAGGSGAAAVAAPTPKDLTVPEKQLAAAYGLMEADGFTDPKTERFRPAVSTSLGEYTASQALFDGVLNVLLSLGQTTDSTGASVRQISAEQWATVTRTLRSQGVQAGDALLALKVQTALAGEVGGGDATPPSSIDIDLPDLEAQSDIEIQSDNLQAMQAIYFAAQLEDLKVFQVVDKLVELFQNGMLPLGKGNAGNTLYDYWKQAIKRMTETERRNLYFRTLGFAGGDPGAGAPNREFNDLWLRFVSAVSSYARQVTVENLLRTNIPIPVSQQQVKKAARDLGANLSLHGYGIGYFAATELQNQIREIITLLSDSDIKTAYGARDMWQVIDQVASLELGGAKNSIRYRTMATSGAIIIRWLATHAPVLVSTDQIIVLDVNQLRNLNTMRARGVKATVAPTDRDLVDACDQWLAVTGTADKNVEDYAQPAEAPNLTSRPIYVPQVARDLLESVGIQAPGGGNGVTMGRKN
jgi:hypothetical protein